MFGSVCGSSMERLVVEVPFRFLCPSAWSMEIVVWVSAVPWGVACFWVWVSVIFVPVTMTVAWVRALLGFVCRVVMFGLFDCRR